MKPEKWPTLCAMTWKPSLSLLIYDGTNFASFLHKARFRYDDLFFRPPSVRTWPACAAEKFVYFSSHFIKVFATFITKRQLFSSPVLEKMRHCSTWTLKDRAKIVFLVSMATGDDFSLPFFFKSRFLHSKKKSSGRPGIYSIGIRI